MSNTDSEVSNLDERVSTPEKKESFILASSNILTLTDELAQILGTGEKTLLRVIQHANKLEICPNIHSLAKVYIEPTSKCNLKCQTCIRKTWDGNVSPCMGLLHSYKNYFPNGIERNVTAYSLGDIRVSSLKEIWNSQAYYEFRNKVDEFDFSPCLHCGTCSLAETNKEDCFGNTFPTCGGCLWAQGIIQCP
ncbi:MAG: hypothetical protein GX660_24705 [Clostridiaceae bacterium]|nr:hypothetical protein [Clostridiaceae bacterium]